MLPPLAQVPALIKRLGVSSLTDLQTVRAEAALEDASNLVREEANQEWANPLTCPAAVITVVLAAARRGYDNPNAYKSETDGDYSYNRDAGEGISLYLTERELEIVRRYRPGTGAGVAGLWTLPTTRGDVGSGTAFARDQYGGDLIPYGTVGEFGIGL